MAAAHHAGPAVVALSAGSLGDPRRTDRHVAAKLNMVHGGGRDVCFLRAADARVGVRNRRYGRPRPARRPPTADAGDPRDRLAGPHCDRGFSTLHLGRDRFPGLDRRGAGAGHGGRLDRGSRGGPRPGSPFGRRSVAVRWLAVLFLVPLALAVSRVLSRAHPRYLSSRQDGGGGRLFGRRLGLPLRCREPDSIQSLSLRPSGTVPRLGRRSVTVIVGSCDRVGAARRAIGRSARDAHDRSRCQ